MKRLIILALILVASPALAAITIVPDHVAGRENGTQTVYFTISDDGVAYKWHGVTPILDGSALQQHLDGKKREFMCGVFRKIYRDADVPDNPDRDCCGDWQAWINAGHKNVTTVKIGPTKAEWKDDWRNSHTVEMERTKAQATDRVEVQVDDPEDNGTEVVVGHTFDDNGDGTISPVTVKQKRKINRPKLVIKDGCRFSTTDGKFYCLIRPTAAEAEAAAIGPGGWPGQTEQVTETILPAKAWKGTW